MYTEKSPRWLLITPRGRKPPRVYSQYTLATQGITYTCTYSTYIHVHQSSLRHDYALRSAIILSYIHVHVCTMYACMYNYVAIYIGTVVVTVVLCTLQSTPCLGYVTMYYIVYNTCICRYTCMMHCTHSPIALLIISG